jgi:hypothetical protein
LMPMESTTPAVVMAVVGGMKNMLPYLVTLPAVERRQVVSLIDRCGACYRSAWGQDVPRSWQVSVSSWPTTPEYRVATAMGAAADGSVR